MTKYYVDNSEILELLDVWSNSKEEEKNKIQAYIINKLSYLIYAKLKTYRKETYYNDLLQEGKIALIEAMRDFDKTRGNNFFKFASWYLSNYFNNFFRKNKEVPCENIEQFLKEFSKNPQEYYETKQDKIYIKKALLLLPEIEKFIIVMRFGIFDSKKYTLQQIGDMFSISKQYVEKIEKKALNRLKKIYKEGGENLW